MRTRQECRNVGQFAIQRVSLENMSYGQHAMLFALLGFASWFCALLLICIKNRTFIRENKSTVLILHPVIGILKAIRSFVTRQ